MNPIPAARRSRLTTAGAFAFGAALAGFVLFAGAEARAADAYAVAYEGAPPGFADKFARLTDLSLKRRAYPTAAALRQVGRADAETVRRALVAGGYYAATVGFRVEGEQGAFRAIFDITPGPLFSIREHRIVYEDERQDPNRPETFAAAGLAPTTAADGASLERNQNQFLAALWNSGFPAARIVGRRADAAFDSGEADAVYTFQTGPRANFGALKISGADKTDRAYIEGFATWTRGEPYERARLVQFRERLFETGNFSAVEVEPAAPDASGEAPILLTLSERKRRTVGVGLTFSTTEGPGARAFLDYRNMFGGGELARAEVAASKVAQSIDFSIVKPAPAFDGSLFGALDFLNETTDAYDARTLGLSAGVSKKWLDERLETRGGIAIEASDVETKSATRNLRDGRTYYVSLPLSATWDNEDDPLALESGIKATLAVTPHTGTDAFTRIEANARTRTHFGGDDRFTIAGRVRFAATLGSALAALPVNQRVYSGGGSSVRGYGYQAVGPIDVDGVPLGGRSAIEAAIEARARVYGPIQVAAFLDAGAVSGANLPRVDSDYLPGGGAGVRYLSPIGPIRADIAFPLEQRIGDADFQLYISLGQPF